MAEDWSETELTPEREMGPGEGMARTARTKENEEQGKRNLAVWTGTGETGKGDEDSMMFGEELGKGEKEMSEAVMSEEEWAEYIHNLVPHTDIEMEDAEEIIQVPDDRETEDIVMSIAHGTKRKRRPGEEKESGETYAEVWNNEPKPISDKRKRQYVEERARGLMTSRWANIILSGIKEGLLKKARARREKKVKAKGPPSIISIRSDDSSPASPNSDEDVPAWGKAILEEVASLQERVAKLESENRKLKGYKGREVEKRGNRAPPPPALPPALPPHGRAIPTRPAKAAERSREGPGTGANASPIGRRVGSVNRQGQTGRDADSGKEEEANRKANKEQEERFQKAVAARRERERGERRKITVTIGDNKEEGAVANANDVLNRLGLDRKTCVDKVLPGGKLQIILDSEEEAAKVMEKGKVAGIQKLGQREPGVGRVVHLVDVKWTGKMEELRKHIEEKNQVTLASTPRWLTKEDTWRTGTMSLVIYLKDEATSQKLAKGVIVDNGYLHSGSDIKTHATRVYVDNAMRREMLCTTCSKWGHTWMGCKRMKKCGICGKTGHKTAEHRCDDGQCKNLGWCSHHKNHKKCANCGGPHTVISKWCDEKANQYRKSIGQARLPARPAWKPTWGPTNKTGESSNAKAANHADD
ncbi:hypothetical protein DFP73DRAFT_596151 [Morchella snyderi]|nr:hypothetical protein DFP73DRAFT_596151 [Morchella snyderi]